ncbi:MAG: hypothetical protein AAF745_13925, partial [Planctomycetota bacterium]
MPLTKVIDRFHQAMLSPKVKERADNWTLAIAIVAFGIHLMVIFANDLGFVELSNANPLLIDPIAAIYTPFSFILVYEVYLLVFY